MGSETEQTPRRYAQHIRMRFVTVKAAVDAPTVPNVIVFHDGTSHSSIPRSAQPQPHALCRLSRSECRTCGPYRS